MDPNGKPDAAWKLYLYSAASSTPVTAYKDTGLTTGQEHPWPIPADANGMMPAFWLADGSYRARGTSSDGSRQFFDMSSVLALGASSGSGGSGTSVDPTAIFQTGDVIWLDRSGTRSGWVRDNGRTVGSATSGATERANSDCETLFEFLWNTYSDTICPVVGGRGASASADWTANKQITLPDKRGYVPGGLDDMGNSAASRYAGVPVVSGDVTTAGSIIGETSKALTQGNLPNVDFDVDIPAGQGSHQHSLNSVPLVSVRQGEQGGSDNLGANGSALTQVATLPAMTGTAASGGSGDAVNKVQRTVLGSFYRKL